MDIMYFVMDAHSFYNFIYFILLIIVSDAAGPHGDGIWGHWGRGVWRGLLGLKYFALRTSPIGGR